MGHEGSHITAAFFVGLAVGIGVGVGISHGVGVETHSEIIERGYGLYCPATGKFAFTGECEGREK